MRIGVPSETKDGERRVALVPEGVRQLTAHGHEVVVQRGAGVGAGFIDAAFQEAGAGIVSTAAEAFDADLVVKVKELQEGEWHHLRSGGMLFSFLHLARNPVAADELLDRRISALAFETVEDAHGELAILKPMSTIAGELAIVIGANLLMTTSGGRGVALRDARVVIVGAGNVGAAAAHRAVAWGADVTVVSNHGPRLARLAHQLGSSARTVAIHPGLLSHTVAGADLVVGAINLPGAHTAKLLTRDDVASMGPGAVLMEVCIDGGGISETAHETSHSHPTYVDAGVTHYAVGNMPAAVPRSASLALASAALPRIMNLANLGLAQALRDDAGLLRGLHVHGGAITHPAIGAALRRPAVDLDALLFAC